jgi:hypothetical protein
MTPSNTPSIPERVAVVESEIKNVCTSVDHIEGVQAHQEAILNTICVNVATINNQIKTVFDRFEGIAETKRTWSDPMLWTNFISLGIAIYAIVSK